MSEIKLTPVRALADAPVGHFGSYDNAPPLVMTACAEGALLHILASGASSIAQADLQAAIGAFADLDIRPAGPGQWFAAGDAPLGAGDIGKISSALAGKGDVHDQSAGRVRIEIAGTHVRDALAKGIAIDLHSDVFVPGAGTITLCGQLGVHISRTGTERYEMIILRSYARSLWDSLIEMGMEFGIDCRQAANT
ncbi:sarcosine oxidase subunit gamma family protein [Thalassospiraceae bacterium LMO-JJ14]|nr:sarcosine oxidase subunit gamma family protein [Thalassospiraceae bacterium LMO-JJ14]